MAALGVLALFLLQLLVISMVMAPREDLGKILEDVDPLWEEQEDLVKRMEEKFVLLQDQLALVESREAASSKVVREKLEQFENILLALGKKVDKEVDATSMGGDIQLITEELKDIKTRIVDVEKRELPRRGDGVGEEMVKELARNVAMETVANQMREEVEMVANQMRGEMSEMETKIGDHMQNLVSENKVELNFSLKAFAQEMVNEKLIEEMEKVRSFETKEKEMMERIQRVEEIASDKTSPEVTEAPLEDWASEEAGGRVVESSAGFPPASLPTLTVLGLPIWWSSNLPSLALRMGNLPGQCWAMDGSQGYLLVKLGAPIHISGVSFQLGRAVKDASSAPRLVSVSVDPYVEPLLNMTTIPRRASEVVTFMLPQPTSTAHSLVKIEILDNHGHPSYTCLHRVMVHGTIETMLGEKEVMDTGLEEKDLVDTGLEEEKEVVDTGLDEEGLRMVDSNPLGRESLQSEL